MNTPAFLHNLWRHKVALGIAASLVAMAAVPMASTLPASADDIRRSACIVQGQVQLCLINGTDTIVLHTDSISQQGVWVNRYWWWPSCGGKVLTIAQGNAPTHHANWDDSLHLGPQLAELTDSISRLLARKTMEHKELEYYLRSHGVQDEGYTKIAHYAEQQTHETDSLKAVHRMLKAIRLDKQARMARRFMLQVAWFDADGQRQQSTCEPLWVDMGHRGHPIVVQTDRSTAPWGAYAVGRMPWTSVATGQVYAACVAAQDTALAHRTLLVTGSVRADGRHDLPTLFAPDGSPMFNRHGRFVGLAYQQHIRP